jgi:hypothetical protein
VGVEGGATLTVTAHLELAQACCCLLWTAALVLGARNRARKRAPPAASSAQPRGSRVPVIEPSLAKRPATRNMGEHSRARSIVELMTALLS